MVKRMARLTQGILPIAAAWLAVSVLGAGAQAGAQTYSPIGGAQPETQDVAAQNAPVHTFEVATIRPTDRNAQRNFMGTRLLPSGRFQVSGLPLQALVWSAYVGKQQGRVNGGPKWTESDQFDIEAKVDEADMMGWEKLTDAERMERVMPLLRALLQSRFKLKLHTEVRVTPVYALVQTKSGAKLKEVAAPPANADPQELDDQIRGNANLDKQPAGSMRTTDKGWVGSAVQVRWMLGQIGYEEGTTDRLMVDETGLTGYYDFAVKLSHDKEGPTVAQQIEDQLGLKVEERKLPIETYVIDSAEKPSEN